MFNDPHELWMMADAHRLELTRVYALGRRGRTVGRRARVWRKRLGVLLKELGTALAESGRRIEQNA